MLRKPLRWGNEELRSCVSVVRPLAPASCSGVAPVLLRCCSLGYPLGRPCAPVGTFPEVHSLDVPITTSSSISVNPSRTRMRPLIPLSSIEGRPGSKAAVSPFLLWGSRRDQAIEHAAIGWIDGEDDEIRGFGARHIRPVGRRSE